MGRRVIVAVAVIAALVAGVAAVLLVGATDPEPATSGRRAKPAGIRLSFIQQRFDEGTRRAQVRVVNDTRRPVRVLRVGVDWPGYPGRPQPFPYVVPAGFTIDLRYVLPRPDCDPAAVEAPAYAVITTRHRGRIRQPMPEDGLRFLHRVWQTACTERRVRHAADVGFTGPWREHGEGTAAVLDGRLLLTRREGDEGLTVDQVQGSVLFDLSLPGGRQLPPGADRVALPLAISPGRCDQHGRSQSTTTFVFRLWLRLGDGEPLAVVVSPDRPVQQRFLAFLDRACG